MQKFDDAARNTHRLHGGLDYQAGLPHGVLRQRHINLVRYIFVESVLFDVADNSNYLRPRLAAIGGKSRPGWISRFPDMIHRAAVHNRHIWVARPVRLQESPSAENGDVQRIEVRRTHNAEISLGQ